ncbi:hypothetical protein SSYM_0327 [Serratia symbiotica str. Tucson]|uniref:Uncharacterized protein n=2 Tax=Serratia symbiotica TaxID=138074 RepID=E9CQZ5_9GAMM|nr:hypothetical protein SSYM_0327 [Serratia symbiotica str. Tucson]BBI91036.1 uncharacterized protein SSYIS1_00400 [Serratia symbiotica]
MKTECYDVMYRRKIYRKSDEIQRELNQWLYFYNRERPHS